MNDNPTIGKIILVSFSFIFFLSTFIIGMTYLANNYTFKCPPNHVCINPENVTCFVFDMGIDQWKLVKDRNDRQKISVDVYYGKAEYYRQIKGVDCYEIDKHFMLGDKVVATLPVDWWRSNK